MACWAGPALAQPALMPVHAIGAATAEDAQLIAEAFVQEVAAISDEPVSRLTHGPCPVPDACFEPGRSDSYWIQLSGDGTTRIAVAYRLDAKGDIASRAVVRGHPGEECTLAAALATSVAAGPTREIVVTSGRLNGAEVMLDGDVVGRTPFHSRQPVYSGFHLVQVRATDGRTAVGLVHAPTGETTTLDLELTAVPRPGKRRVGAWPLIPLLASGAVTAILLATDPAGVIGPDYTLTITGP